MIATREEQPASVAVTQVKGAEPVPLASSVTVTGVENEPTGEERRTVPAPGTSGRENAATVMVVVVPRPSIDRGMAMTSMEGASAGWQATDTIEIRAQERKRSIWGGYTRPAPSRETLP